ncbi:MULTISPECIES: DUF488 domain-containing protein [unclassified Pseudomonas]|uniref:DUF488 domain-containing protein n=1 Tax=unclassified Pseudomonas TaxID=196821 RepID=UPI0011EBBC3D|nr:DUF488 domain-containing protein [Pseudomonas sp. ANT_H4]KAA0945880.1 DUF488 domain-containing protein [Pseudomonas sp. ANT_H14]
MSFENNRALNIKVFWINQSFHNYTDYALPEEFEHGFLQLSVPSQDQRCALIYSEAVLWRCHRRIVVDNLLHRGRKLYI